MITLKDCLKETGTGGGMEVPQYRISTMINPQMAFNPLVLHDVAHAYKQFIQLHSHARRDGISLDQARHFIENVYYGGYHNVKHNDFIKYLKKKDIVIFNEKKYC